MKNLIKITFLSILPFFNLAFGQENSTYTCNLSAGSGYYVRGVEFNTELMAENEAQPQHFVYAGVDGFIVIRKEEYDPTSHHHYEVTLSKNYARYAKSIKVKVKRADRIYEAVAKEMVGHISTPYPSYVSVSLDSSFGPGGGGAGTPAGPHFGLACSNNAFF